MSREYVDKRVETKMSGRKRKAEPAARRTELNLEIKTKCHSAANALIGNAVQCVIGLMWEGLERRARDTDHAPDQAPDAKC